MHWNVERHTHFEPGAFFQYHHVFERTRRGGAITGYAHHGELFNGRRGLALDVPFGLVDFIELLQGGRIATEGWYQFLNMGYRIRPAGAPTGRTSVPRSRASSGPTCRWMVRSRSTRGSPASAVDGST